MMKWPLFPIAVLTLISALFVTTVARGQSGQIVINGALATANLGMAPSGELNSTIAVLSPRFVIQSANALRFTSMTSMPVALQAHVQQIGVRVVLQYALANRFHAFSYPREIVGDTAAPQVSQIAATRTGVGIVRITWVTNEFTTSIVDFGASPGVYTQTVSDYLYFASHSLDLSNIPAGATIYFRIRGTDRSGNPYQTAEYSFSDAPPPATATNTPTATPIPTIAPPPTNTPTPTVVVTPIKDPVGQDAHHVFMPAVRRP